MNVTLYVAKRSPEACPCYTHAPKLPSTCHPRAQTIQMPGFCCSKESCLSARFRAQPPPSSASPCYVAQHRKLVTWVPLVQRRYHDMKRKGANRNMAIVKFCPSVLFPGPILASALCIVHCAFDRPSRPHCVCGGAA